MAVTTCQWHNLCKPDRLYAVRQKPSVRWQFAPSTLDRVDWTRVLRRLHPESTYTCIHRQISHQFSSCHFYVRINPQKTDKNQYSNYKWNSTGCRRRLSLRLLWPWTLTFWPKTLIRYITWPNFDEISSNSYEDRNIACCHSPWPLPFWP